MRSLSLLRLIEKFAEIRRQVSLRSLTTAGLGVLRCSFRFESVSIAECFAFCSETTSPFFEMGLRWAAAQTRLGLYPKPLLRFAAVLSSGFFGDIKTHFSAQTRFNSRMLRILR